MESRDLLQCGGGNGRDFIFHEKKRKKNHGLIRRRKRDCSDYRRVIFSVVWLLFGHQCEKRAPLESTCVDNWAWPTHNNTQITCCACWSWNPARAWLFMHILSRKMNRAWWEYVVTLFPLFFFRNLLLLPRIFLLLFFLSLSLSRQKVR